jgi:hypothetical protein
MTPSLGADPAFVPTASSRQGVSTKGFNRGEGPPCPYLPSEIAEFRAWHLGFQSGCKAANEIWDRAMTYRNAIPEGAIK